MSFIRHVLCTVALIPLYACTPLNKGEPQNSATPPPQSAQNWGPSELTYKNYKSSAAHIPCPVQSETVRYIDPLPHIITQAKTGQIVMINESHSKPLHRAFIGEVAAALRPLGYAHYGAEALGSPNYPENRELAARGYPLDTIDGFYIGEPIYGQLIERAIALDYRTFGYENYIPPPPGTQSRIAHRDENQANNIIAQMKTYPEDKFLNHAGYEHIRENIDTDSFTPTTWMTRFFTQKTGLDPLTINQTDCFGDGYFEDGTMGYAMPVDEDGTPITYDGFDILIIPPSETYERDRPLWLRKHLGRSFVNVPMALRFDDEYTRITAYNIARQDYAVAEDTIYRAPHSDKPLALRPGSYRIEVRDKDKTLLGENTIKIVH